jgi:hypothetical protein
MSLPTESEWGGQQGGGLKFVRKNANISLRTCRAQEWSCTRLKRPIAAYLRDGIHELRPSYQGVHYRLLYFFAGPGKGMTVEDTRIVVVSHGLVKEQAVPNAEIDRAIERKRRFDAHPERHTFNPALKR